MEFTDWLEYEYQGVVSGEDDYCYCLARKEYFRIFRPNLFFAGLNPRWQMYKFLPQGLNVMYSAFGFWDNKKREWRKGRFKRIFGLRWLDCGGFSVLNQYTDYPFSIVNLANLVARLEPDFYAPNDYPCEPEISRSLGLMGNDRRIEATVKNAVEMAQWESQLPGQMVPVIQGYSLNEYLYCLEMHEQAGTIRDYMAVGSMCRRISDNELGELIPGIYHAAQKLGCTKLHFFGLKLSKSVQVYDEYIWSRDSAAILMHYDKNLREEWGGRFPKGQSRKEQVFMSFLAKLRRMELNYD